MHERSRRHKGKLGRLLSQLVERQAVQLPVRMQAWGELAGSGAEHGVRASEVLPQRQECVWMPERHSGPAELWAASL